MWQWKFFHHPCVVCASLVVFCLTVFLLAFFLFSGMAIVTVKLSAQNPGSITVSVPHGRNGVITRTRKFTGKNKKQTLRFIVFADEFTNLSARDVMLLPPPDGREQITLALDGYGKANVGYISLVYKDPFAKYAYNTKGMFDNYPGERNPWLKKHYPATFSFAQQQCSRANLPGILLVSFLALWTLVFYPSITEGIRKLTTWKNAHPKIALSAVFIFFAVILAVFACDNVTNPNTWLDESGQFGWRKGRTTIPRNMSLPRIPS